MSLRPNARTEVRRHRYKVAVDADEGRRRREDNTVEIRKSKREESLQKKRRVGLQAQQQFATPLQTSTVEKKLESLPSMAYAVWSDDSNLQLEATTEFRKLLSIERSPPIEEVIQSGVVPRFVEFLVGEDFPQLQLEAAWAPKFEAAWALKFEAAWALTNIASENTKVVIDHGAVPKFVKLLSSRRDDVREQAVWALGNVAGDSPRGRDLVLRHGLIPLLDLVDGLANVSMLRTVAWTLSNLFRGEPQPQCGFELLEIACYRYEFLVRNERDEDILTHACQALCYLSEGTNTKIRELIKRLAGSYLGRLVLYHPSPSVGIPALCAVRNIATGDEFLTESFSGHAILSDLRFRLKHNDKKSIKQEACWTISNITAGNAREIGAVIKAGLIAPLVSLLQNAEFDVKKEAAWAISNAASGGIHYQIEFLVGQGCIKPLCDLLGCSDPETVTVCLEGLENILKVGRSVGNVGDVNLYAQMIDVAGGFEKIRDLQSHGNNVIRDKAFKILETNWLEEEDEVLPPGDGAQPDFNFGGNENPVPAGGFYFD